MNPKRARPIDRSYLCGASYRSPCGTWIVPKRGVCAYHIGKKKMDIQRKKKIKNKLKQKDKNCPQFTKKCAF